MSRPQKLNPMARNVIAKSYHAGMRPCELAKDYAISSSLVIQIAQDWDLEQRMRRLKTIRRLEKSQVIHMPAEMEERMVVSFPRSAVARELGIYSVRVQRQRPINFGYDPRPNAAADTVSISLPFLRFQHGDLSTDKRGER